MNARRMIVRRVAPNGMMLVSMLEAKPSSDAERVRLSRLLLLWWDRAMATARRLDLDAALKLAHAQPVRAAMKSYSIKSRRASTLWAGINRVRQKIEDLVIETASRL